MNGFIYNLVVMAIGINYNLQKIMKLGKNTNILLKIAAFNH